LCIPFEREKGKLDLLTLIILARQLAARLLGIPSSKQEVHPLAFGLTLAMLATLSGAMAVANEFAVRDADGNLTDWLIGHVASHSRIAIDAASQSILSRVHDSEIGQTWEWRVQDRVDLQSPGTWIGVQQVHYLVLDERSSNVPLQDRVDALMQQQATLLYRTQGIFGLGGRRAVLWTFKPDIELKLLFDDSLYLAGYTTVPAQDGSVGLLFHWYTTHVPKVDYQLFIHVINTQSGQMIGQVDGPLGNGTHPTSTWTANEIVFETVSLPANLAPTSQCKCTLEFGLYQLKDGTRSLIKNEAQQPIGDHFEQIIK